MAQREGVMAHFWFRKKELLGGESKKTTHVLKGHGDLQKVMKNGTQFLKGSCFQPHYPKKERGHGPCYFRVMDIGGLLEK